MLSFINLTPHEVRVVSRTQTQIFSSQGIARVENFIEEMPELLGVPIFTEKLGQVTGLPDPDPEKIFIVSRVVRDALPEREDLMIPGDLVRDEKGAVIGCRGLIARVPYKYKK